jgi:hypothetical protein
MSADGKALMGAITTVLGGGVSQLRPAIIAIWWGQVQQEPRPSRVRP